MASIKLENIKPELLRWAIQRAGFSEERAIDVFPTLGDWLSGAKLPTMSQLQKFASKFHTPFGFLFLDHAPVESIPIPMFRGEAGHTNHFDLDVYDTVLTIQNRQDWLEDYLRDNDIETCPIVNIVTTYTPIRETVTILRERLQLEPKWAFSLSNPDCAVNQLTERIEQLGIFVAFNGVVGNNPHRVLKVSECRGFALVNDVAPYIFVNSHDSKSAQLFTLIHEVVHIMLGTSAGDAGYGEDENYHNETERYCDRVAAEFLVPTDILQEVWCNDLKRISRKFKVSELVIARRGRELGLLSSQDYREFWVQYSSRVRNISTKSSAGGDFYRTSAKRVGKTFAIHVRNAVNSRQLSYTEAYRLTGLQGRSYDHFMLNNV
jgi:Zn-dependent peptidase ImmA (M78 family)